MLVVGIVFVANAAANHDHLRKSYASMRSEWRDNERSLNSSHRSERRNKQGAWEGAHMVMHDCVCLHKRALLQTYANNSAPAQRTALRCEHRSAL